MGFQEKPLSISLELTVPQTDTGGRAEYAQALERGFTQARQKVIVGDKEYGGRISRSVSQMEKDEQNGANPEVIGAYIAKIAEKKCKPICVAGAQYKFLSLLCKLLPCGIRGKIVGAIYAK